jgi:hypothetical protein
MPERHTVEIRTAAEVRDGDEILTPEYKAVRIAKAEQYPGSVILYDREGPPRHAYGSFGRAERFAVLVRSSQEPTDAEVERAARALCQEAKATDEHGDWNPWDRLYDSEKEELRREVRAVLKAARGSTDVDSEHSADADPAVNQRPSEDGV